MILTLEQKYTQLKTLTENVTNENIFDIIKLFAECLKEDLDRCESSNEQVYYTLFGKNEALQEVISMISKIDIFSCINNIEQPLKDILEQWFIDHINYRFAIQEQPKYLIDTLEKYGYVIIKKELINKELI